MNKDNSNLWITTILPFGMGYFITMAFRSVNAVLAHPILESLSLNHAEIGFVTSIFLLTFAITQIPLGILLDSWGARKTQTLFFFIGGVGIIIFALASDVGILALGRGILGVGMAGGLMAAFKAVTDRVQKDKIPYYNGIILAAGGVGALIVTTPAKLFQLEFGWRSLCITLGIITFIIALLIFFLNRDIKQDSEKALTFSEKIRGLITIYKDGFFWRISPLLITSLGGFIAMQGLWLGPWLHEVVGFSLLKSADYLFVIAIAMILGFISGGFFSKLSAKSGLALATIVVIGIGIHILTQIGLVLNFYDTHYITWFIYGYFAQVTLVNYAILAQHFGPEISGRALTAANILIFVFAFVVQYFFGLIVHYWPKITGTTDIRHGFKVAFAALIILEIIALVWYVVFRPKSSPSD